MDSPLYTLPGTAPDPTRATAPAAAPAHAATSAPSLGDAVHAELRAGVLGGRFGPRERLTGTRPAARVGVSRTPVREAPSRLTSDELIERGEGGHFVTVPDPAGLRDLNEVRVTLLLRGIARAIESPPGSPSGSPSRSHSAPSHAAPSRASGNPALSPRLPTTPTGSAPPLTSPKG